MLLNVSSVALVYRCVWNRGVATPSSPPIFTPTKAGYIQAFATFICMPAKNEKLMVCLARELEGNLELGGGLYSSGFFCGLGVLGILVFI